MLYRSRSLPAAAFAALMLTACERPRDAVPVDTTGGPPVAAPDAAGAPAVAWDPGLGPVLLVSGELPEDAWVVPPGSAAIAPRSGTRVALYDRAGSMQAAIAHPAEGAADTCVPLRLEAVGDASLAQWTVGFAGADLRPLPLDSLEGLSRTDSSRLVAQMTRLASMLPGASDEAFGGLPFRVLWLWRFTLPGGPEVVVAGLIRQIAMEAAPAEERTLLVAERSGTGPFVSAYFERSRGAEETIESREILNAALLGAGAAVPPEPVVFLMRDFGDGMSFSMLRRGSDARWEASWQSVRRSC